jgi:hypothetical protein
MERTTIGNGNMFLPSGEQRRLGLQEDGWNLTHGEVGRRTRGGGEGRPDVEMMARRKAHDIGTLLLSSDSSEQESSSDEDDESSEEEEMASKKPKHQRVILEVSMLQEAFKDYTCPECQEPLELKIRTICIASSIDLVCNNKDCSYVCQFSKPTRTAIHADDDSNYERITDYALNVLFVLGMISVGDGATEAGRMLGFLGLPNDTTMTNRSFGMIEERVGPFIRQIMDEIIDENVVEEARLSMNEFDFTVWKTHRNDPSLGELPTDRMPQIDASYDMAWQQKGSGHSYCSQSGHGTLFGSRSRKLLGIAIKSRLCWFCTKHMTKNPEATEVPAHECWKNHDGSAGSMEAAGAVQVVVDSFEKKKIVIRRLCCDDDSSIRADCQWSNADYLKGYNTDVLPLVPISKGPNKGKLQTRPDKGILPPHVPEPRFVADPNHRRKGLNGVLIKIDMSKASDKCTMTRMDSTRIAKNFGYMARTLKTRSEAEYDDAAKACLEHHFDNHEHCGSWCKRKALSDEEKKKSVKYYRSKKNDSELYELLKTSIERFCTHDKLLDMAHTLDTNMNEAFNQICTWFAPKNKVFSGSGSLPNRIAFAVGINSLGIQGFFTRLFKKMGIPMAKNVAYYLKSKEKHRVKRLEKLKTPAAKLHKNKRKLALLSENTKLAKKERHKRAGTYKKGMNLDDPFDEEAAAAAAAEKAKKKKKKKDESVHCEYCGRNDHVQRRSKKCLAPKETVKKYRKDGSLLTGPPLPIEPTSEAAADGLDQDDCSVMDGMPWDTEYASGPEEEEGFVGTL